MKKTLLSNLILLSIMVLFVQDSRAETTLAGHASDVTSVAFSPDGTIRLPAAFPGFWLNVTVAFSPDGTILASGLGDGTVRLWDVATRTNTATLKDNPYGVESVAFSPDGTTLATASLYSIRLWDVATRTNTATFAGERFESVAFSPDGTTLATASWDGIKLWDVATRTSTTIHTIILEETPYGGVKSVAFSSEGTLATASDDGTVKLWDVATGNAAILEGHTRDVFSVAFSRDGMLLASGSKDKMVKLWNVATRTNTATFAGHTQAVTSVAFSPDGTIVASASADGTVKLWDAATHTNIATLEGHTDEVSSVAFSPDGTIVASASADETIKLWNVAEAAQPHPSGLAKISGDDQQGSPSAALPNPLIVEVKDQYGNPLSGGQVTFTVIAGEGKLSGQSTVEHVTTDASGRVERTLTLGPGPGTYTLVRVSAGRELVIFSAGTPDVPRNMDGDYWTWHVPDGAIARLGKGGILDIAYSADGTRLAVGSSIGVWVYNALTGEEIDFLAEHTSEVRSVAFNPDGSTLASGSQGGTIHLWDATTGQHQHALTGHRSAINSVAFNPDGSTLASGSQGGTTRLWDATTGQHLKGLATQDNFGDQESVNSIALSPDGSTLASAVTSFLSGKVHLWDATTGQHMKEIETGFKDAGGILSIAFSPDGSTLAGVGQTLSGAPFGSLYLWDVDIGSRLELEPPYNFYSVYSVAFSPDGSTLASGTWDGDIDLWDADTGQHQQRLIGHAWPVRKVAFSPEGKRFASGGGEELFLWDTTGLPLNTVAGHERLGRSVAFSADGTLAIGGWEGTFVLWDMDTGQHLKTATGYTTLEVHSVAFNPDGSTLAITIGPDVRLWDGVKGENKKDLIEDRSDGQDSGIGIGIGGIGFGDTSGGLTGIRVGDITLGFGFGGDDDFPPHILSVAFSRDGSMLAAGDDESRVKLIDVDTERVLNTLEGHTGDVWGVAFSPEGTLASGSADGTIRLWDATGQSLNTLEGHADDVRSVAFSPDGTLASGSADGTIRLWDVATGQLKQTLEGHTSEVWSVAFSQDGSILASGSLDGTTLVWDVAEWTNSGTAVAANKLIGLPGEPQLQQNAPNPFNSQTAISYFLPKSGPTRLEVFSVTGQRVAVLRQGDQQAGYHHLHWNGRNREGRPLASGMYLYRLVTEEGILTRKLTLLR